jgi:hypothetical protein
MVDLPDAERPVNQIVKPFCLRKPLRSARERDGCHVMLLGRNVSDATVVLEGYGGVTLTLPFWML